MTHVPVLLQHVIEGLNLPKGATVVDATVGGAGYTKALCDAVGPTGVVVGLDQDEGALARAKETLADVPCTLHLVHANFRDVDEALATLGISEVDGIAFDLGLSSTQLEESGRGFSFMRDEPLLMTFREKQDAEHFTARDIVNSWKEDEIANVLTGYAEERNAKKIAKAIVEARRKAPIETTTQLVEVITTALGYKGGPIHPATRTFQALRIAVNDELGALDEGLAKGYEVLKKGGRMAVVSFHSLEDRKVKEFFKEKEKEGSTRITKKPIPPGFDEVRRNPRSRSAKLRILEK
ncbi:16S rRNA (cytosine(1402)-N(4))-methyltransferase RsmH [Candidatus Campbellbacteria bacterium]|nr:MAG: 16S rRNA (cytosine(1402)-N(4))-methyltransferase RsmH [Candidatus Campbellbacteria bacterium]